MTQQEILSAILRHEASPPRERTEEHIVNEKGRSFGKEIVTPKPMALAMIAAAKR